MASNHPVTRVRPGQLGSPTELSRAVTIPPSRTSDAIPLTSLTRINTNDFASP